MNWKGVRAKGKVRGDGERDEREEGDGARRRNGEERGREGDTGAKTGRLRRGKIQVGGSR